MDVPPRVLEGYIDNLVEDYQDLQVAACDTYDASPSALEALRMISKGHPAVIKGFSPMLTERDWRSPETYTGIHSGEVTIAVTDDGLADSVRDLEDGSSTFVKPLEERMTMSRFLENLQGKEVLYLQSQDGNIFRAEPGPNGEPELAAFQAVVAPDVAWMKDATGNSAEAVNLWIGTSRSTTSFHHDPYENIYHVLSGSKTFTLVSPIDGVWFEQPFYPPSTLVRTESGLEPQLDAAPAHPVPWVAELDVPPRARAITVRVGEGDTLFLPSGWWHKVEQSEEDGTLAVAVNYWYTSELRAERYAYERFVGRIARLAGLKVLPVDPEEVDEDVWASDDGNVTSADEWDPKDWGR